MLYMCAASQQTICLYKTSPEFQCVYTVYSLYCTMYPNSPQLWVWDPLLKAPPWLPPSSSVLDGAVPRTWAPGIGANTGGLEVEVENRWSCLFSSERSACHVTAPIPPLGVVSPFIIITKIVIFDCMSSCLLEIYPSQCSLTVYSPLGHIIDLYIPIYQDIITI